MKPMGRTGLCAGGQSPHWRVAVMLFATLMMSCNAGDDTGSSSSSTDTGVDSVYYETVAPDIAIVDTVVPLDDLTPAPDTEPPTPDLGGDSSTAVDSQPPQPDTSTVSDTVEPIDTVEPLDIGDTNEPPPDTVQPPPEPIIGVPVAISDLYGYVEGNIYAMAVDKIGRVSVLWSGQKKSYGPVDFLISWSDPLVTSFSSPVVVSTQEFGTVDALGGDIATDGAQHLIVWRSTDEVNGVAEVRFRRTGLPLLTGVDVLVASEPQSTQLWRPYFVRKSTMTLGVLWQQGKDIRLAMSQNGGKSFAPPVPVDPPGYDVFRSDALYTYGGKMVVAFHGKPTSQSESTKTVYVVTSEDDGVTFSSPFALSDLAPAGSHLWPSMALGPSDVFVGWHRSGGGKDVDGWLARASDGMDWKPATPIPGVNTHVVVRAGKGKALYATGDDTIPPFGQAVFAGSANGGLQWSKTVPLPVSENYSLGEHRSVANRKQGLLHIGWWEIKDKDLQDNRLRVVTVTP